MKSLASIVVVAAALTLGGAAVEQGLGSSAALAQRGGSSACLQNCARVRDWPINQCREYCRKQEQRKAR
jgi:hypothetical protein